jgi:serine/threonine-protein kinase
VVRQFVERSMAKDPGARFPSAAAMGQVARRAAGGLAAGGMADPTSGGPSGPISAPPGRPYSGAPVSGSPASPLPSGTRVMPNYAANGPVSPAGGYARGAASVPAAAPVSDTGYSYGYAEPTGPTGPRGPAGGGTGRSAGKRGSGVGVWVLAAIVLVLVFCVGGYMFLNRTGTDTPEGGQAVVPPTTVPSTTRPPAPKTTKPKAPNTAPAVKTRKLDCDKALNENVDDVRSELEDNNFKVRIIKDQPGGKKDTVAGMSPCGKQTEGTEVTLRVFTGDKGDKPDPGASCNPFDPGSFASCLPR